MTNPLDPVLERRLIRLEEGVAFADRASEEASSQLADLYRRLESLAKRIDRLERRLEDALTADPDTAPAPGTPPTNEELQRNKPPHSA